MASRTRSDSTGSDGSDVSHSSDTLSRTSTRTSLTSDDDDAAAPAHAAAKEKIPRGSHACTICRRLKMRCVTEHSSTSRTLPTTPCTRCARLGNTCVFQESRRGKRVRKDAKIEAMTKRMRAMEDRIAQLQARTPPPPPQQQQQQPAAHVEAEWAVYPTAVEPHIVAEVEGLLASLPQAQPQREPLPHHAAHPYLFAPAPAAPLLDDTFWDDCFLARTHTAPTTPSLTSPHAFGFFPPGMALSPST